MSFKYEIVTTSVINLPDDIIHELNLTVLPLSILVGDKEYLGYENNKSIDSKKFYEMLREGENIKTSQVNQVTCREVYESILKEGKDIIDIGFSSALSGTYNTSKSIAKELLKEYPDRKIISLDSRAAAQGYGMIAYYAGKKRLEGATLEECADYTKDIINKACHYFKVDDLQFLKRGGRIPASTALIGTIMNIKPIMYMPINGKLEPYKKVKGNKKARIALIEAMKEKALETKDQVIFISHGDCLKEADKLATEIKETFEVKEVVINMLDVVIGCHSGPGTIALFFLGNER